MVNTTKENTLVKFQSGSQDKSLVVTICNPILVKYTVLVMCPAISARS